MDGTSTLTSVPSWPPAEQHQRRATRRRRTAVTALAVLTLLSAGTAGLVVYSNSQAVSARNQAITNQVVAEAEQAAGH